MHYDIIGDIHGCSETLEALLDKLGYTRQQDIYQHPERQAIFLGDFIDRGPHQREVIGIVRPMIELGYAQSVMGNHEFNAIAYATPDSGEPGEYLRKHIAKNNTQHQAFLAEYSFNSNEYEELIDWFRTLPMWLDLGDIRVVHACWDRESINLIRQNARGGSRLTESLLANAAIEGRPEYNAVEKILKGVEVALENNASFHDKDGNPRNEIRVKWWDSEPSHARAAFLGPESAATNIPEDPINVSHLIPYAHTEPPVFLGHYWLEGDPKPLAPNIACLDYSVAKHGSLVAYRWDGETELCDKKFVSVPRVEPVKPRPIA
jgi:hypothetical protein